MNVNPLISVVIPIYNKELYLKECLDSVLNQSYKNIEVICIDDGSTDSSVAIVEDAVKKDNRVSLYRTKHAGPSSARNLGIENSKGDYIHFMDADDLLHVDAYRMIFDKIVKTNSVDLVTFMFNCFEDGKVLYQNLERSTDYKEFFGEDTSVCSNYSNNPNFYLINGAGGANLFSKLFKLSIIQSHNLKLNEKLRYGEDAAFYYKYLFYCDNILSFAYTFYFYRVFDNISFTANDLNNCDTFADDFQVFEGSIDLYKQKNNNVCKCFAIGSMRIIFIAYMFITNYGSRLKANLEFSNFIKKYNDMFRKLDMFEIFKNEISLLSFNKESLISNTNYEVMYKEKERAFFAILNSKSYKIGRIVLWPFRFVKRTICRK